MARSIDADELKNAIHESYDPYQEYWAGTISRMHGLIDEQPTVDAVEVVRCEDCKHRFAFCCYKHRMYVDRDDFCSWGAKMDGNKGGNK